MTDLEKIALERMEHALFDALDRCAEKNAERMNHERTFIRRQVKEAIEICRALYTLEQREADARKYHS